MNDNMDAEHATTPDAPQGPRGPRWVRLVPNTLSALRLVLAVVFWWLPVAWHATAILTAGLSDFIDGWVARRFNATSWVGGLLDAVSDKAFTLVVLVTFAATGELAWWQLVVLVLRDVTVGLIALYAAATRQWTAFRRMSSRWFGKAMTAVLFVMMLAIALDARPWITWACFVPAALLGATAAVDYFIQFVRAYRQTRERDSGGAAASSAE